MSQNSPSLSTYQARADLRKYEENGLLLYAIQLPLDIEDIDSLAAVALTDGSDDKKCDLVYVDQDSGLLRPHHAGARCGIPSAVTASASSLS